MLLVAIACSSQEQGGPFDYPLVKSKLKLSAQQGQQFDEITAAYMKKLKAVFENPEGGRNEKMTKAKEVSALQDKEIQSILSPEQFEVYQIEMKIEREGREKHNMGLIRNELALDSTQTVKFNMANQAFYTTLIDNHDYYHGKPDVYLQYYKEIDLSRQKVFKEIMTEEQYTLYKSLEKTYHIGKSEH